MAEDDVRALRKSDSGSLEARVFRKILDHGIIPPGRTEKFPSDQGYYAVTPRGEVLASAQGGRLKHVIEMMDHALDRWKAIPAAERLLPSAPAESDREPRRPTAIKAEEGGLKLRVTIRDRVRVKDGKYQEYNGKWKEINTWNAPRMAAVKAAVQPGEVLEWNPYYTMKLLTLKKEEAASLLSGTPVATVGKRLAQVLYSEHNIWPHTGMPAEAIERAEVRTRTVSSEGGIAKLELEGVVRWDVKERGFGFQAELLGRAEFDLAAGKFTAFEMVAYGPTWGLNRTLPGPQEPSSARVAVAITLDRDAGSFVASKVE